MHSIQARRQGDQMYATRKEKQLSCEVSHPFPLMSKGKRKKVMGSSDHKRITCVTINEKMGERVRVL